jgi:LPXTG-site transpeptidase (sortase) family protein
MLKIKACAIIGFKEGSVELKKHLDFRRIGLVLYFVFFALYLLIGLRPVEAVHYDIRTQIEIPAIDLVSDVAVLDIEGHGLNTPNTIAGSFSWADNKTLLIGHSTTVFSNLEDVEVGEEIIYDSKEYVVSDMSVFRKEDIVMEELLEESERDTIVIMTCAGELLDGGDATHRLIVTAVAS